MRTEIDITVDDELRDALEERFRSEEGARIHLKIVSNDGFGLIWVELQMPGEDSLRKMTLAQALTKMKGPSDGENSPKMKGRSVPANVLALSGIVAGSKTNEEHEYRAHQEKKYK